MQGLRLQENGAAAATNLGNEAQTDGGLRLAAWARVKVAASQAAARPKRQAALEPLSSPAGRGCGSRC